ncbi:MAG: DUF1007 family protein [Spirochaetaceae bacterium]|nr:DUF1007 family protein [Spirochaetaceae bacterium]
MHFPRLRALLLASVLLLAATAALWAHPHMSLDSRLEFEMKGGECLGIRVEWLFDPMFSASIIGENDLNHDGRFDKAENERVRKGAFANLANYGYFIFLRKGDKRVCPDRVEAFEASQRDGRLVYRFRVPLEGKGYSGDFSVAVFDSTFYCAVRYPADPASVRPVEGTEPRPGAIVEVAANKKYPVFYNPSGAASDFRVYDKWQKGLETAYPEEVRLHFAE